MTSARALSPREGTGHRTVLARQGGVISRAQALQGGLSPAAWRWRTSTAWQTPFEGVAVAHTGPLTDEQRSWCAVLAAGAGAALSGDRALAARGWTAAAGPLDVAVPGGRHVVARTFPDGTTSRPRRVTDLARLVHPLREPPVVQVRVAALHAAAWAPSDRAAEWRLASVVQQRLTTAASLRAALADLPSLRRHALVGHVLDDVELGAHAQTELDLLALLRRQRLPRPDHLQLRDRDTRGLRYLDAWWERQRVAAEVDGAHHRLVSAWEQAQLRANAVAVAHLDHRVVLLRSTAAHLRHDEPRVVEQLRGALR